MATLLSWICAAPLLQPVMLFNPAKLPAVSRYTLERGLVSRCSWTPVHVCLLVHGCLPMAACRSSAQGGWGCTGRATGLPFSVCSRGGALDRHSIIGAS